MARPLKDIDAKQVELLAGCGCTVEEIAAKLDCTRETIYARFSDSLKKGRAVGKSSLRGKQFEMAMRGNVPMLIWLGKQMLNQRDQLDLSKLSPEQAAAILSATADTDSEAGRD